MVDKGELISSFFDRFDGEVTEGVYIDKDRFSLVDYGQSLKFLFASFKELGSGAYCFIDKQKYSNKKLGKGFEKSDALYLPNDSIVLSRRFLQKPLLYKINVENDVFTSTFKDTLSLQPIIKGKLEEKVYLKDFIGALFEFVGYYKH